MVIPSFCQPGEQTLNTDPHDAPDPDSFDTAAQDRPPTLARIHNLLADQGIRPNDAAADAGLPMSRPWCGAPTAGTPAEVDPSALFEEISPPLRLAHEQVVTWTASPTRSAPCPSILEAAKENELSSVKGER